MSRALSKFTKFATSLVLIGIVFASPALADAKTEILRKAVISNGLVPVVAQKPLSKMAEVGKLIFESKALSLNGNISCEQCHLDEFGTADGIPLAVGVSGEGKGSERVKSAYRFLARNTQALWGRGAEDFQTFFWDGRVSVVNGKIISQFGDAVPSADPLTVAVHLPPVETVEMLEIDEVVGRHRQEDVETAHLLYGIITDHLKANEPSLFERLSRAADLQNEQITFVDVATGLAAFIRENFRVRESKLHRFAFGDENLSREQLEGGLIFYGKGRCSVCHTGPHFSDFKFHAVPFPQLGQGRNGFGVDYGRFNITHDPSDLYRFRTPPLWDVANTGPYGHSGSVVSLEDAVRAHFDPLALVDLNEMDQLERHELYKRMMASGPNMLSISSLTDQELIYLAAFLRMLDQ